MLDQGLWTGRRCDWCPSAQAFPTTHTFTSSPSSSPQRILQGIVYKWIYHHPLWGGIIRRLLDPDSVVRTLWDLSEWDFLKPTKSVKEIWSTRSTPELICMILLGYVLWLWGISLACVLWDAEGLWWNTFVCWLARSCRLSIRSRLNKARC